MRIVSLLSSATEMLFALGLGEQVFAVSHECDCPPEALRLPKATRSLIDSSRASGAIDEQVKSLTASGGALYRIDAELIRELRPDLIVTQAQCDVCAVRLADVLDLVASAPELRSTRVLSLNPSGLADVFTDIQRIADATGRSARGREYCQSLESRIAALERLVRGLSPEERPRVVVLEWLEPLMTAGNWTPELVSLAGGTECLAEPGRHSGYVEWSEVARCDPDVLIVSPCGFDLPRTLEEFQRLPALAGWDGLAAVRTGRVFAVDGNAYLNRSGPRLVDTVEILAHLLQPKRFGRPAWAVPGQEPWKALTGSAAPNSPVETY